MMEGLAYLREMNVASVLLRLTVAMLFGGFIGLERERKRRPAGFRTYMLVCLGAALTMLLSQYESYMVTHAWHETAMEIGLRTDVSRFGAQVINGIGFLGAGTIIVTDRRQIRGLTTAAGLWVTAAMGIAIGAGLLWPAVICFCLILITNYYLHYMTQYVENHTRVVDLYVELEKTQIKTLLAFIKEEGYELLSVERRPEVPLVDGDAALRLNIDQGRKFNHRIIVQDVRALEGIHYVEELG